jgi:hypothetical protein
LFDDSIDKRIGHLRGLRENVVEFRDDRCFGL